MIIFIDLIDLCSGSKNKLVSLLLLNEDEVPKTEVGLSTLRRGTKISTVASQFKVTFNLVTMATNIITRNNWMT